MGGRQAPAALPQVIIPYPKYRRRFGPQGGSERVGKIPLTPGFDPWTVQPVASYDAAVSTKQPKYVLPSALSSST